MVNHKKNITKSTLCNYFHLPINDAAKHLGVCVTMLKKTCRKYGISRWPYRRIKCIDKKISVLRTYLSESPKQKDVDLSAPTVIKVHSLNNQSPSSSSSSLSPTPATSSTSPSGSPMSEAMNLSPVSPSVPGINGINGVGMVNFVGNGNGSGSGSGSGSGNPILDEINVCLIKRKNIILHPESLVDIDVDLESPQYMFPNNNPNAIQGGLFTNPSNVTPNGIQQGFPQSAFAPVIPTSNNTSISFNPSSNYITNTTLTAPPQRVAPPPPQPISDVYLSTKNSFLPQQIHQQQQQQQQPSTIIPSQVPLQSQPITVITSTAVAAPTFIPPALPAQSLLQPRESVLGQCVPSQMGDKVAVVTAKSQALVHQYTSQSSPSSVTTLTAPVPSLPSIPSVIKTSLKPPKEEKAKNGYNGKCCQSSFLDALQLAAEEEEEIDIDGDDDGDDSDKKSDVGMVEEKGNHKNSISTNDMNDNLNDSSKIDNSNAGSDDSTPCNSDNLSPLRLSPLQQAASEKSAGITNTNLLLPPCSSFDKLPECFVIDCDRDRYDISFHHTHRRHHSHDCNDTIHTFKNNGDGEGACYQSGSQSHHQRHQLNQPSLI